MHCHRISESDVSVRKSASDFVRIVFGDSGGLPCYGSCGNYECFSYYVSSNAFKNGAFMGDYDAGNRKDAGRAFVFLPADRPVEAALTERKIGFKIEK